MDVSIWLRDPGLADCTREFRANDIDAEVSPCLTAEDLTTLGMKPGMATCSPPSASDPPNVPIPLIRAASSRGSTSRRRSAANHGHIEGGKKMTARLLTTVSAANAALAAAVTLAPAADAQERVQWRMQSAFPSNLPHTGVAGKRVEAMVDRLSGGNFELRFFEPGALVPALECFDAAAKGGVEAVGPRPASTPVSTPPSRSSRRCRSGPCTASSSPGKSTAAVMRSRTRSPASTA
jgi:hypothetical protein